MISRCRHMDWGDFHSIFTSLSVYDPLCCTFSIVTLSLLFPGEISENSNISLFLSYMSVTHRELFMCFLCTWDRVFLILKKPNEATPQNTNTAAHWVCSVLSKKKHTKILDNWWVVGALNWLSWLFQLFLCKWSTWDTMTLISKTLSFWLLNNFIITSMT